MVDDITPHMSWIFEAGAVVAGVFYLSYRRLRHRMLKVRHADMLLIEIESIGSIVDKIQRSNSDYPRPIQAAPDNIYTGLVNSTNISFFDTAIQYELHKLIRSGRTPQHSISVMVK